MKLLLILFVGLFSLSLAAQTNAQEVAFLKDIVYKVEGKDTIALDIHLPKQEVYLKSPVAVFIHGGGWAQGNKDIIFDYTKSIKDTLQNSGYAVVSIDYRLVNKQIHIVDQLSDCRDAIQWIVKNANKYNFDVENIGLWGESAGAHLALMTAYNMDSQSELSKIRYVIDNFGPTDLNGVLKTNASWFTKKVYKLFLPELYDIRERLVRATTSFDINTHKKEAMAVASRYSPIEYIETDFKTPTLILHGNKDIVVPFKQSKKLHKKLNKVSVTNKLIKVKKGNHGFTTTDKERIDELIKETHIFVIQHYYKPD